MDKLLPNITEDWTLFLDRDGTINQLLPDDYVSDYKQFKFIPGALEALSYLKLCFKHIFIVTNQQGIGKDLMTHDDLKVIHQQMMEEIWSIGGRIDQIYYCSDLAIYDPVCRKPNPGMAIQAKHEHPEINFSKSIMIGDAESDVLFGKQLNMFSIRLLQKQQETAADLVMEDLFGFYQLLKREIESDE